MPKDRMRAVAVTTVVLELAFLASFLTVAYGSLNTLTAALQGGEPVSVKVDLDPATGAGRLTFEMRIENRGFYGIHVGLRVRLLTSLGQEIADGGDEAYIEPGASKQLSVVLALSRDVIEKYGSEHPDISIAATFDYRTFLDLVGFRMELVMMP